VDLLKKIALIAFGVGLAIVLLEALLQGAHWYAVRTRLRDSSGGGQEGLKILCVGESTTESGGWDNQTGWPKKLERLLRERLKRSVVVYNRGMVGAHSTQILNNLPTWLSELKPTLVITMIGINDDVNVLVYRRSHEGAVTKGLEKFRLYRFVRMLLRSLDAESTLPRPSITPSPQLIELQRRKRAALESGDNLSLIPILESLADCDPSTPIYYYGYLKDLLFHFDSPDDLARYASKTTGTLLTAPLDRPRLQELYDNIDRLSLDPFSLFRLKLTLLDSLGRRDEAEGLIRATLANPLMKPYAAARLAAWIRNSSERKDDISVWRELLDTMANRPVLRRTTALYLLQADEFRLATLFLDGERAAREVEDLEKSRGVVLRQQALALWMSRDFSAAERLFKADTRDQILAPNIETKETYPKIIKLIKESGSMAIAMQYPMMSIEPLPAFLSEAEPDGYIDNEKIFMEAVLNKGYSEVFSDVFAGSFGHTTEYGNDLLAGNVADYLERVLR
jgi:hypothetical protein